MAHDKAYREAEKKIEAVRRSGATELDLNAWRSESLMLTELPESLSQLTWLQSLILSGNRLTSLPEWLGQLTHLKSLDLLHNQLSSVPSWIERLIDLEHLHLFNNPIKLLPPEIGSLKKLLSLDLRETKLQNLPPEIGQLKSLITLTLGKGPSGESRTSMADLGELISLPAEITQLSSLEWLALGGNRKLGSVPSELGKLARLKGLGLSDMQLKSLPESLGQCHKLRRLDISGNQLTSLPESLGQLRRLEKLYLGNNRLTSLPESLGQLTRLEDMNIENNQLASLPEWPGHLTQLRSLDLSGNKLVSLPEWLSRSTHVEWLALSNNQFKSLPEWLGQFSGLYGLQVSRNYLKSLPASLAQLKNLERLELDNNPLNPELAAAYKEGLDAVKRYLCAKAGAQVVLNEAKLILIGEGEVGKSCLLDALRDEPWMEHDSTHGIEIKPVKVNAPDTGTEIILNAWDFGGQRVYRPTHQLFFSAPAVYLVVWKPREGPQQGFVKEWIKLVKHREPDAKILVVATHGGPGQRQPDVDRQEIWDLFGRDRVLDFFLVESKPDEKTSERRGIAKLKEAIGRVAASLPEMGRTVPARWQQAREALIKTKKAYLPIAEVLKICRQHKIGKEDAKLFVKIYSTLGHFIHYEHDPALRDIVILKPDWLATAISFVLDDKQTRDGHGLVKFSRLNQLWNDQKRKKEFRYPAKLHPVFLRLMERFDLSYVVAGQPAGGQPGETSLIAQLVPDVRPEQDLNRAWPTNLAEGDEQQVQICRMVDASKEQSATAEGLFYQLIVRLHKFSLGRVNYSDSVHWQRGLVLDYDYNGRALLEHVGNDVRITVRAPSPVTFLSILTHEVKWLVENFWEGMRCEVVVPCVEPCGKNEPGRGVFEVQKLIAFKRQGMMMFPCIVSGCNQAQDINCLLQNAPAARRTSVEQLLAQGFGQIRVRLDGVREQLNRQDQDAAERFQVLDLNDRRIMSQVEDAFRGLMQTLTDEAKEGPRLFSIQPVDPGWLDLPKWISKKFRLTLWCEHSRLPLPGLNGEKDKRGVYELELPREWLVKAAPFLKLLTSTLSLVLPVASSTVKLALDDAAYKRIERELDLAQKTIDSVGKGLDNAKGFLKQNAPDVEQDEAVHAQGAILRQLQVWLKEKDPSFGGLIRVQNKRHEFLWVHPQFEKEY
jgi:Leucine-rich repeat (LRR) protein